MNIFLLAFLFASAAASFTLPPKDPEDPENLRNRDFVKLLFYGCQNISTAEYVKLRRLGYSSYEIDYGHHEEHPPISPPNPTYYSHMFPLEGTNRDTPDQIDDSQLIEDDPENLRNKTSIELRICKKISTEDYVHLRRLGYSYTQIHYGDHENPKKQPLYYPNPGYYSKLFPTGGPGPIPEETEWRVRLPWPEDDTYKAPEKPYSTPGLGTSSYDIDKPYSLYPRSTIDTSYIWKPRRTNFFGSFPRRRFF